jgi:hypothetical protein
MKNPLLTSGSANPACLLLLTLAAPLALSAGLASGSPQTSEAFRAEPALATVTSSLAAWNQTTQSHWRVSHDPQTGYAQFIYGGNAPAAFAPSGDSDFEQLGRLALESTFALHGIESGTLVEDRFTYLPLGLIGSSDKATCRFRQEVGGVPVLGGYLNTLFDTEGRLLSVQSTAMPSIAGMETSPSLQSTRARTIALEAFESEVGLAGEVTGGPDLAIYQLVTGLKSREARLVWTVDVRWHMDGLVPEAFRYQIDAQDGTLLSRETLIHHFDVGGTISSMVTTGNLPDQGNNPEQSRPLAHAFVNGGAAGTVVTDENGNFNFPGVTGPINVTLRYRGDFANVINSAGGDYSLVQSVNGTGNNILLNPSSTATVTSQANSFREIGQLRDWVRQVNPTDIAADFQAISNVNIGNTCNAFYDGVSVNFYSAGGGCPNTSYSGVIAHEMGHWLNTRYGTGNGSDGMGEGNADVFAMYLYNTAEMGEDFLGVGTGGLRTGHNNLSFCGDASPGCYGAVHTDGQPWMGATWKVYEELVLAHGAATADSVSDALFLGWMNSYNQTQIKSVIETQWLTLDDNNGNIGDGTPHYTAIDTGFRRQGFPGVDLALIQIAGVTDLPDTTNEAGPYTVNATISSLVGSNITTADLKYRVSGGPFVTVPMSFLGGNQYSAGIPGQVSPATVSYYLDVSDALGNTLTSPSGAPGTTLGFHVGIVQVLFSDDFEGAELGWTHASFLDTPNVQDDWQRGAPNGLSGDPTSAASGTTVWANDLGATGWNGEYQHEVHSYLRSPVINCSSAIGTTLRFKRWLTVEEGIFDQARIMVNGTQVWTNPLNGHLQDSGWVDQEVDISSVADGVTLVQIEFSLQSDVGLAFGGWTIDDFEVLFIAPSGGGGPTAYCNPPGGNSVSAAGLTLSHISGSPGGVLTLQVDNAPLQPGILFFGVNQIDQPFGCGRRCVGGTIVRSSVFVPAANSTQLVFDTTGTAGSPFNIQYWYRDPANNGACGNSFNLSNGLGY